MSPKANKTVAFAADETEHRHLFGLVKTDNHVAVERFLAGRKDAAQLAGQLMDEAVSARMVGVLGDHVDDVAAGVDLPMATSSLHASWAWPTAL